MIPRVLVVDDSSYVRLSVARALKHAGIEVVGFARDGAEAVQRNLELEPDVIVLDLQMPNMNGVEALREIRQTRPVPVLVFASLSEQGAELAVRALGEGAVDVLPKPQVGEMTIDLATRVWALVSSHDVREGAAAPPRQRPPRVVLVAASTGGPPCVERLLTDLPQDFPVPVVVAQHMPAGFTRAFADRLDGLTDLHIFEGYDGATLGPGEACILPGGAVSTLAPLESGGNARPFRLAVDPRSGIPGAKPNASVLFMSALGTIGGGACAVVMTGMGADGADAVPALVTAGATVIAQDPKEAVIASMPNAAIAAGAQHVAPVERIPRILASLVGVSRETHP